jgi:peroxiredoxin Q/BCP
MIGTKAKPFTLLDAQEQQHALTDYKDKWVVLYFYPKDNTPGCTLEAMEFTALANDFKKLDAAVIGVSTDSCASHQRFIEKKNLDVVLLSDPGHEVAELYGSWAPKKFMGREFLGVVRSTILIDPLGIIAAHWPKVKAKGHAQEVLEKIKELKK